MQSDVCLTLPMQSYLTLPGLHLLMFKINERNVPWYLSGVKWNYLCLVKSTNHMLQWKYGNRKMSKNEDCFKSSWTHLTTPSQNFVEAWWWWWSLFWSTSHSKWCTSYNAPPTSRKCAADRLLQASGGASELPFHDWKSPEIIWSETLTVCQKKSRK